MKNISITELSNLVEQFLNIKPYKEQLYGVKQILKGNIVQMKTGEGKSIVMLMASILLALKGRKVFFVTSNDYLIKRDYEYGKELTKYLGIETCMLTEGIGGDEAVYEAADIIYAQGSTLIYDYLRGIKVNYDFALIDEIDFILVEQCNHEYSVSDDSTKEEINTYLYNIAKGIIDIFNIKQLHTGFKEEEYLFDYQEQFDALVDPYKKSVALTNSGFDKCTQLGIRLEDNPFFFEILNSMLVAKYCYINGRNYIVEDGKIVIIDESTGRITPNGQNDLMIQTSIEVLEGVPVTKKSYLKNGCSYPVFFSLFSSVSGLSGTATLTEDDFALIYHKRVYRLSERVKNKRIEETLFFDTDKQLKEKINELVTQFKDSPILIITDSDKRSHEIFKAINDKKRASILDNCSLAEEEQLLSSLSSKPNILISSRIVGRGTDISLKMPSDTGLIVILSQRFFSRIAERQAIGRTARNGSKGRAYILTSLEDPIFLTTKHPKKSERTVRSLQKIYDGIEFEQRKCVFLRSKLFFLEDEEIKSVLEGFASFRDIAGYISRCNIKKRDSGQILSLINLMEVYNISYESTHFMMLKTAYERVRLEFQQQFLRYSEIRAFAFKDNKEFSDFLRVVKQMREDAIATVVLLMLEKAASYID